MLTIKYIYCLSSELRIGESSIIPKRSGLYYCDFANLLRLGIGIFILIFCLDPLDVAGSDLPHSTVLSAVIEADLDVDTNRNGTVDNIDEDPQGDEAGEDRFTRDRGAVVVVNSDDDNKDGNSDFKNGQMDGEEDVDDISKIVIRIGGLPNKPSQAGLKVVLKIASISKDLNIAEHVRIFSSMDPARATEILGPNTGVLYELDDSILLELVEKGEIVLGIEALRYIGEGILSGEDDKFDGQIRIQLEALRTGRVVAKDQVQLMVAPVVFSWNGQDVEEIHVTKHFGLYEKINAVLSKNHSMSSIKEPLVPVIKSKADFIQDYWEFSNTSVDGQKFMPVVVDLDHENDSSNWPLKHVFTGNPDYGYLEAKLGKSTPLSTRKYSGGEGGNFEMTPPTSQAKLGYALIGTGSRETAHEWLSLLEGFVKAQRVQPVVRIPTSWLEIAHIDEVLTFIPKGEDSYTILVASPVQAMELMHQKITQSKNEKIWVSNKMFGFRETTTIAKLLIRDNGKAMTKLAETKPAGIKDTRLELAAPVFKVNDIIRVDNELMQVIKVEGHRVDVDRGLLSSEATSHEKGSIIYCLSDLMTENIWGVKGADRRNMTTQAWHKYIEDKNANGDTASPQNWIDHIERKIRYLCVGEDADIRYLPVIFNYKFEDGRWIWKAHTANVMNSLVVGHDVFMLDPGPGETVFETYVKDVLKNPESVSAVRPRWIDWWVLGQEGALHCGTNVRRMPLNGRESLGKHVSWWEAWE